MQLMQCLRRFQVLLILMILIYDSQALVICRNKNAVHVFNVHRSSDHNIPDSRHWSKPPQNEEEETQFDSLDVLLDRARKRNKVPLFLGKLQAVLDRRVLPFLSIGDILIVIAALVLLDAKGFAIGLVIGKATLAPLRKALQSQNGEMAINLVDFYPAVLAILLDQVF